MANESILSSDIYQVSDFLDDIRENNIPDLDNTSSMIGIFGYMNEMFSQSLQNSLIVSAETSNEAIPTRAKFTKNVINHAMNLGITDIYARPASMAIMIYLPINYIEANFVEKNSVSGKGVFILSKNIPIMIDNFEFHLDYNVIITRLKNTDNNYVYTAIYDLFENGTNQIKQVNPLSNINNPYISTITKITLDGVDYIALSVRVHQVKLEQQTINILTNNDIENKSITFNINEQLASFDIDVIYNDETIHIIPVYRGLLDNTIQDNYWCYYEFLNNNTIRILFDRESFIPKLNSIVNINISLCNGSAGNFTYNNTFRILLNSQFDQISYKGMYAIIQPLNNGISAGGKDRKTISDLRRIIPREASSRGAIINTTDLQNFFNSIDDTDCMLYFKKRRDNQFERMYYTYLLMRYNGNVYPTNTLNIKINEDSFNGNLVNNNLSLPPGTIFYYYNHGSNTINDYATTVPPEYVTDKDDEEYPYDITINEDGDYVRVFKYISPFLITIDDDLISSYFMTIMKTNKLLKYLSVNIDSPAQFISTNLEWKRKYIDDNGEKYDNKYIATIDIANGNNVGNYTIISTETNGNGDIIITKNNIKVFMVLYNDESNNHPYRYLEGTIKSYDSGVATFEFELETDDLIDLSNRINIKYIYNTKPEAFQDNNSIKQSHGYMNRNTYARIYTLANFYTEESVDTNDGIKVVESHMLFGDSTGNKKELEEIIPTKQDIINGVLTNTLAKDNTSIVDIINNNEEYKRKIDSNINGGVLPELKILQYLNNNRNSEFVQETLLNDANVLEIIDYYKYEDLSDYTLCNVLEVDGGLDFYYDYSFLMKSNVSIKKVPELDDNANQIYNENVYTDLYGTEYTQLVPLYKIVNNRYVYDYTLDRVPLVKDNYFTSDDQLQEFVSKLDKRRRYINECIHVLEDTYDIDFKFFNTYGPSKMFYYNNQSAKSYKAKVSIKTANIYSEMSENSAIVSTLSKGQYIQIIKTKNQWGYIAEPVTGWIRLLDIDKCVNYIDNVSLNFVYSLEAEINADNNLTNNIVYDIKNYIEDINNINELHIPNIITLITNSYREQLVYFDFNKVNQYDSSCKHFYLDTSVSTDVCPEFLNIATKDDNITPDIDIVIY